MMKENCVINPLTKRAVRRGTKTYNKIKHLLDDPQESSKSVQVNMSVTKKIKSVKPATIQSPPISKIKSRPSSRVSSVKTASLSAPKTISVKQATPLKSSKSSKIKAANYLKKVIRRKIIDDKIERDENAGNKIVALVKRRLQPRYEPISILPDKSDTKPPPPKDDTLLIDNVKVLQTFLRKKLIKDRYSLKNRIAFTKYVEEKIKSIPHGECAKPYTFNDGTKGFTIKNIIFLNKIIGTPSAYGKIYLSSIKNSFGGFAMVAKMMRETSDNLSEIRIMKTITNKLISTGKSKHFIINVGSFQCKSKTENKPNERLLAINELAHGDLKMAVNDYDIYSNEKIMINIYIQIIIAIATFQIQTSHYHNDCHWGNFLYQRNNDVGWYKYTFNGNIFYLKSCGLNMCIYDYGLARKIPKAKIPTMSRYLIADFHRISLAFITDNYRGWNSNDLPEDVVATAMNVKTFLTSNATLSMINDGSFKKRDSVFQYIFDYVLPAIMSDYGDIITTQEPDNVINQDAFII
jgi:hypothetical protein